MADSVIVIGAGGHASVVADAVLAAGGTVIGFTDADHTRHGLLVCGLPVLGDDRVLSRHDRTTVRLANGLGTIGGPHDERRRIVQEQLSDDGWQFVTVRHPAAIVSRFATVADGAQLLALSVVQAGARIGTGVIINTSAVIEHDSSIGAWTHVAPGAVVCGGVQVGERSLIGAGAIIRQQVVIGSECLIAAGAVVVKCVASRGIVAGVPAQPLRVHP